MVRAITLRRLAASLVVILSFAMLLYNPSPGFATPLLGPDLSTFAVLGFSTVTNVSPSVVVGNVGLYSGTSITGFNSSPGTAVSDTQVTSGLVHTTTTTAFGTPNTESAQGQLTTAILNLNSLAGSAIQQPISELAGLTLSPGVYSFSGLAGGFATLSGTSAIPGVLTLDGGGNLNAAWVFLIDSTLTTSAATAGTAASSVVNVINTGANAGVYWNVGVAATIGTYSTFEGNILAQTISLNTGATDGCGRALANPFAVTMQMNTIGLGCAAVTGGEGSNGFSGGLDVTTGPGGGTVVSILPPSEGGGAPVPEPSTLLLLAPGLIGAAAWVKQARPR